MLCLAVMTSQISASTTTETERSYKDVLLSGLQNITELASETPVPTTSIQPSLTASDREYLAEQAVIDVTEIGINSKDIERLPIKLLQSRKRSKALGKVLESSESLAQDLVQLRERLIMEEQSFRFMYEIDNFKQYFVETFADVSKGLLPEPGIRITTCTFGKIIITELLTEMILARPFFVLTEHEQKIINFISRLRKINDTISYQDVYKILLIQGTLQ